MRTFADPSLFRLIYILLGEAHSDLRRTKWSYRGIDWQRERHSFSSSSSGFAIDRYLMTKPHPGSWSLIVVKEMWWDGNDKVIRSVQWAKPLSGNRAKILEWLRAEERRIAAGSIPDKAAE